MARSESLTRRVLPVARSKVTTVVAARTYTVRVVVRKQGRSGGLFKKIFGGGAAAISLKFEEQGAFPVGSSHRSLKLESLKTGNYTLELIVEEALVQDAYMNALTDGFGVAV